MDFQIRTNLAEFVSQIDFTRNRTRDLDIQCTTMQTVNVVNKIKGTPACMSNKTLNSNDNPLSGHSLRLTHKVR